MSAFRRMGAGELAALLPAETRSAREIRARRRGYPDLASLSRQKMKWAFFLLSVVLCLAFLAARPARSEPHGEMPDDWTLEEASPAPPKATLVEDGP